MDVYDYDIHDWNNWFENVILKALEINFLFIIVWTCLLIFVLVCVHVHRICCELKEKNNNNITLIWIESKWIFPICIKSQYFEIDFSATKWAFLLFQLHAIKTNVLWRNWNSILRICIVYFTLRWIWYKIWIGSEDFALKKNNNKKSRSEFNETFKWSLTHSVKV